MSKGLSYFLKDMDPVLHDKYLVERYKSGQTGKSTHVKNPDFSIISKPVFKKKLNLPLASTNSRASDYLKKRKINPVEFFYADKFKHFCNTVKPTFESTKNDHARIVIPMYDENKDLIGFQGRALDTYVTPKYLTVMLSEDSPKVYGLDRINQEKPVYIVEGPFDSTLVENSVAMCGSDIDIRTFGWSDYIWVYDNEPRSRQITDKISKSIDAGDSVVIWPKTIRLKDLNDMHNSGIKVKDVVQSNVYRGLEAKLKLSNWKV